MNTPAGRLATAFAIVVTLAMPSRGSANDLAISVAAVRRDTGGQVAANLASALCREFRCVPGKRIFVRGRIDFAAARREGVGAILFGTVGGTTARPVLALALLRGSLKPEKIWRLPLDARRRPRSAELAVVRRYLAELDPSGAAPRAVVPDRTPRPPPPAPPQREEPAVASTAVPPPSVPPPAAAPASAVPIDPGPSAIPRAPPSPSAPGPLEGQRRTERWMAVDIGTTVLARTLEYQGVGDSAATLIKTSGGAIWAPSARVEVLPWAGAARWWIAGLTAFGSYRRSVGFALAQDGKEYSTLYWDGEAGVGERLGPASGVRLEVTPTVSYRWMAITTARKPSGLADAHLSGPAAGLDLFVPLGSRLGLIGRGSYTFWRSTGDVVSSAFFPKGSASGLDASVGFSVRLWGRLSLRATGEYTLTRYAGLGGSAAYTATGATDRYVGARAVLRWAR